MWPYFDRNHFKVRFKKVFFPFLDLPLTLGKDKKLITSQPWWVFLSLRSSLETDSGKMVLFLAPRRLGLTLGTLAEASLLSGLVEDTRLLLKTWFMIISSTLVAEHWSLVLLISKKYSFPSQLPKTRIWLDFWPSKRQLDVRLKRSQISWSPKWVKIEM